MNQLLEKYKWLKYLIGGLIVAFGILVIVLALVNGAALAKAINIILAVGLFLLAGCILVMSLMTETHKPITLSLFISAVLIALGVTIIVVNLNLPAILAYMLAVFLIAFGGIALAKAIMLIIYKQKALYIVLMFVLAALGITAGILGLCYSGQLLDAAYIILGTLIIVAGILYMVMPQIKKK